MRTAARNIFTTIRTEGALLPADFLQHVAEGNREIEGLSPDSYHLVPGEKLNEAINRSWNRLLGAWTGFKDASEKLGASDLGTGLTRERWLLPLFQELGYGRLQTAKTFEIDGKNYPISHGWQGTPIHLVGCKVDLDRRTSGVVGAALTSPHGLVQEMLNRSEAHLWGFVSNGHRLRILRDNITLTRQAFVEFDLAAMFDGEVYADFVVLWLLCHESRVEGARPDICWLEKWSQFAEKRGTRVLEDLRTGVENAINAFGSGFLAHPANRELRNKLSSATLNSQDYYRQLLRVVYRILFLFVAEDRGLLFEPKSSVAARELYSRFYSVARLRRLAERRAGTQHPDLWRGLTLVFEKLDTGCAELALPALGSFLWSRETTSEIAGCELANRDLLKAIHSLAFTVDGRVRRVVDYKNLGSEELGSIYEALLELHPQLDIDAATFSLTTAAGNERKTTGSYYTPTSLVNCLLGSALDPVLDEACKKPNPEQAILNLKVCDPATGSGHFLIAAAHRLAKRLAALRTGDDEPSPVSTRTALRDVIGRCLYGVDVNPMAVELCKVSLWLEALEPGKPLSFLDHRIKVGNSLLGATPALIEKGIPDEAFTALEGDDKTFAAALKRANKAAGEQSNMLLFSGEIGWQALARIKDGVFRLEAIEDDTLDDIHAKQAEFEALMTGGDYQDQKLVADAWCTAFTVLKTREAGFRLTEEEFNLLCTNPSNCAAGLGEKIKSEASKFGFFHWHIEFPEVFEPAEDPENLSCGWRGGFDLMLGNPPWDALSPDAKEFFSRHNPEVRSSDKNGQLKIVTQLLDNPHVALQWSDYRRKLFASVHFFKNSGRYRLFAQGNLGKGDFNIFRMFVETSLQLARPGGYSSQLVPEGLYNGANSAAIRSALFSTCELRCLLGFQNIGEVWFKNVYYRTKFCLYAARTGNHTTEFRAAFNVSSIEHLRAVESGESLSIPVTIVREFSPDALAVMEFKDQRDIDIAEKMYTRWPRFGDHSAAGPFREYMCEIHMGNDRDLFTTDATAIPLYEGRMVDQFDHRAKGYCSGRGRAADWGELPFGTLEKSIRPQWYIPVTKVPDKVRNRMKRYRLGFCDVASSTNERSLVAALIPPGCLCGHTVPTIVFPESWEWSYLLWLGVANSFAIDWLVRQKVQLHMTYSILDSVPFPRVRPEDPIARRIVPLVMQLTACGSEMTPYLQTRALEGWQDEDVLNSPISGVEQETMRLKIRAKIDAAVASEVFGLSASDMEYILASFRIAREREDDQLGEFRTRRLILEAMSD